MDTTTHDDDNDGPEFPTNWEEFISADGEMPYEADDERSVFDWNGEPYDGTYPEF